MNLRETFSTPRVANVTLDGVVIRWEPAEKKTVKLRKAAFIHELANLSPDKGAYANFIEKYGAVFGGNESVHLIDVWNKVLFFRLAHYLLGSIGGEGQPALAKEIEQIFFKPLANWEAGCDYIIPVGYSPHTLPRGMMQGMRDAMQDEADHGSNLAAWNLFSEWGWTSGLTPPQKRKKRFVLYPIIGNEPQDGIVWLYPVDPKADFWPTFEKALELKDWNWEERKNWLLLQLLKNALTLLERNIDLKPYVNKTERRIDVEAVPKDAYTWAVASLFITGPKQCPMCDNILTAGERYCSRRCEKAAMSTAEKQAFLDYLGQQHRRDKLSDDEYDYIKERAKDLFEDLRDEEREGDLKDEVLADISEKWPERDFSFLNGYGTKRGKGKP